MDAVTKFTESTAYNFFIQLSFRASTFILNAVLLRHITRDMLGVVNVRLMLFYTTVSFFAREPFRRACLQNEASSNWRQTINVLWFCPLVAISVVVVCALIWIYGLSTPQEQSIRYYPSAVLCYGVAIFIESLAEPLWVFGQSLLFVKLKAFVEAFYIALRQFLFAIFIFLFPDLSLLNFGAAMIISSTVYTFTYYVYFVWYLQFSKNKPRGFPLKNSRELFPITRAGLDYNLVNLTRSFWRHSLVKQLLTEGERYVMTVFNILNFADQGIYDVITNLGSLAARIIFAPLEESAYVYFTLNVRRGFSAGQQNKEDFSMATKVFSALLKLVSLIGCIIFVFGLSYSYLALKLYGGDILSTGSGPTLLRWYCVYVVFLAINGITECFTFAIMPEEQVDKHQKSLFAFCISFLVASLALTSIFGSVGFILANCINMICRIVYSCVYIHRFYSVEESSKMSPLGSIVLNMSVVCALFVSSAITLLSAFCDALRNEVHYNQLFPVFMQLCGAFSLSPVMFLMPRGGVSKISALITVALMNNIGYATIQALLNRTVIVIFCCSGTFNTLAHIAVGAVCLFATFMTVYSSELEFVDFIMTYILRFRKS